jgi:hypothetical protein
MLFTQQRMIFPTFVAFAAPGSKRCAKCSGACFSEVGCRDWRDVKLWTIFGVVAVGLKAQSQQTAALTDETSGL